MGSLQETHRFYFIPPSNMKMLSQPDFIGFWASERQQHSDQCGRRCERRMIWPV